MICQQIFSILALIIFLLKFLLKSASKSSFCRFGVEIPVLELQFPTPLRVVLYIVFCKSVSADRNVMAASRLLRAAAACVILFFLQLDLVNSIGVSASRLRQWFVSRFINFGASNFRFKIPFKKCFKIVVLLLWRRDPVLELQFLLW